MKWGGWFAVVLAVFWTACAPEPADERDNGLLLAVEITPGNPSVEAGATLQLTANAVYQNGFRADVSATASWTSSDTGVATVSVDGMLSAANSGTTEITAAFNGLTSVPEIVNVYGDAGTPTPTPGACDTGVAVLITEMGHSTANPQSDTEFVEIYNAETSSVDVSGWTIEDTDGATNTFAFPASTIINAQTAFIISRGTIAGYNTEYGNDPDLNNSGITLTANDGILLEDCEGTQVDVVISGSGTAPGAGWTCAVNNLGGQAAVGRVNLTDTDDCADWADQAADPGNVP